MKTSRFWMVIPTALAVLLANVGLARSQATQITLGLRSEPVVVTGTSGGSKASKSCGMISAQPNYVVNLNNNFNYLRFNVKSAGNPTLLIEGPNGSFCVPADRFSGGNIQAPGFWEKGIYSIYIGDRAGGQHPYTLSITQKRS